MSNTRFLSVPVQPSQQPSQPAPVQSLDQWAQGQSVVQTKSKTGSGFRLPTKAEFKAGNPGLKGNALSRAYNAVIREHGQRGANFVGAFIAEKGLLLKGIRDTKNTVTISLVKKSAVKDPTTKAVAAAPSQADIKAALASMSREDLEALLKAAK